MTADDGRKAIQYLVRCALPVGDALVKQDQNGAAYTFQGGLGLAPQYKQGACDGACQQLLTACVLAHVNTSQLGAPLWLVSGAPSMGWDTTPAYPIREASFFGNVWSGTSASYYCASPASATAAPLPGRLDAATESRGIAAYQSADDVVAGTCAACESSSASGLGSCAVGGTTFAHVVTTWKARSYLAENAALGGDATLISCATCQRRIGSLNPGATVTFHDVEALAAGASALLVFYTDGDASPIERTLDVSVNGSSPTRVTFPSVLPDWNAVQHVRLPLGGFVAGAANSVTLTATADGAGPDLVWIEVLPTTPS